MLKNYNNVSEEINHHKTLAAATYDANCQQNPYGAQRIQVHCVDIIPKRGYQGLYIIETDDVEKRQTIAIRGTNLNDPNRLIPGDVLTDIGTRHPIDPYLNVPVHVGFQKYAQAVYHDLLPRMKNGYSLTFTGHSMGGAAALLVSMYVYSRNDHPPEKFSVYTFGQPKLFTNQTVVGWSHFADKRVYRIVNCDDVVPILPTKENILKSLIRVEFFDGTATDDYQHLGRPVLLMDSGKFWMTTGGVDIERKFLPIFVDTLKDAFGKKDIGHAMLSYDRRLVTLSKHPSPFFPDASSCRQDGNDKSLLISENISTQ